MEILNSYDNADAISIDTLALEEIILEERAKEISELKLLSKKVGYLHTSILYYRNSKTKIGAVCYEAWKTLVKKIGGSPNAWRDIGSCLGINTDDLDYILNSVRDDPADIILKVYMQNEKATLDNILDALVKLKRFDILKAIEQPISNLAQCFNKEDSGYQSNTKNSGQREIISFTKNLVNDLPAALNKNYVIKKPLPPNEPSKPKKFYSPPIRKKTTSNDSPILFLTFAEDGLGTSINIQDYVQSWTEITDVNVITLNNRKNEVYENPEKFIREYFDKADYVVPIITNEYLNSIRSNENATPTAADILDFKYVKFIYSLIITNYIHASGCINKKVRSVLPQNFDPNIVREITMYPDLMPWVYEMDFDTEFQEFLKR